MQLIIDIPDKIYNYIKRLDWPELEKEEQKELPIAVVCKAVKEGMPAMFYPQVPGITPTVILPTDPYIDKEAGNDG